MYSARNYTFYIKINRDDTIFELKEVIKAKNQQAFVSVDAKDLKLWKVEIRDNDVVSLSTISLKDKDELLATRKISNVFLTPFPRIEQPVALKSEVSNLRETFSKLGNLFYHGKRKPEGSDEENEGSDRKKEKVIDLNPKFLAEFFEKQEGIKDDFTELHELCMNEFKFERKGRDDAIYRTYDYIFDRYCTINKQLSEGKGIGDKKLFPLLVLQSAPGGGKSFFLDELASLKSEDLNRYLQLKLSNLNNERNSDEKQ
ncbi:hypothetical protein Glove_251g26 [Diversispora epigaea]|uniref:Crinkler effector protein N-terminal domain-containing protein n=1 Tax=Diversispora epigaea TaxID=1348612 RepID=A0A397IGQ6_9GLOM|nr:hypothetical protein Glove_251g26 [Diversispora epigaea]